MHTKGTCPTAFRAVNAIEKNTSVEAFYCFLTCNETTFEYDINTPSRVSDWTPMHMACSVGNVPLVKALVVMGAYINPTRQTGGYPAPLDEVSMNGSSVSELIQLLHNNGARAFAKDYDLLQSKFERTKQFDEAMESSHFTKAITILNEGLVHPTGSQPAYTWTRLMAERGNFQMVKTLVMHGGLIRESDGQSNIVAARNAKQPEIADWLEEIQRMRFQRLKICVLIEKYGSTLMRGFFSDKDSVFNKELGGFSSQIAPHIFSFFARASLKPVSVSHPALEEFSDKMELG